MLSVVGANGELRVVDPFSGRVPSLIGVCDRWWTSCGMACDSNDRVFGASRGLTINTRQRPFLYHAGDVAVFHSDGTLAKQFHGAADRACAMCIHENELFVCGVFAVTVFSLDGQRKRTIGQGLVHEPRDCTVSARGELFVASGSSSTEEHILVLAIDDGRLLRKFAHGLWMSALTLDSTRDLLLAVDETHRCLHAFQHDGTVVWNFPLFDEVGRLLSARSICADSTGQVFVLDDADRVMVFDV